MASVQVARVFLKHDSDVTTQNKDWETPLHLASREDKAEVARVLLEQHGAHVTTQNKDGDTPLHLASREDKVEVARVLLEHRADIDGPEQRWGYSITSGVARGQS
jgi:ankyrin repeat protein